MKDLNSLNISGRLVKDCEVKSLDKYNLLTFTIASNYAVKRSDGWGDDVNFVDVKYFANAKSPINEWLLKGVKVVVTGEIRQERWEANGGKQAQKMVLIAKDVMPLQKSDSDGNAKSDAKQSRPADTKKASSTSAPLDDDDIPF